MAGMTSSMMSIVESSRYVPSETPPVFVRVVTPRTTLVWPETVSQTVTPPRMKPSIAASSNSASAPVKPARAAKATARALKGAKRHRFLDKAQRSAPLHQVIVIVILADRVEEQLRTELSDTVGKGGGDGFETAALPCVVDLERRSCTFDSMRLPYVGFGYPVKNRGIRLIRRYLFGGRFPYAASPQTLPPIVGLEPEQTLWRFWRELRDEPDFNNRKAIKRFKKMQHGDMTVEDGYLYLKWQDHGIGVPVKLHTDARTVEVGAIDQWLYPKANKIAKSTVESIKDMIDERFAAEGCAVTYTIDT